MTINYDKKNNRYIGQVMIDGIRKSVSGKTRTETELKLKSYLNPDSTESQTLNLTLSAWAVKWFTTYKVNDYKKGTYDKELRRLKTILKNDIGDKLLYNIKSIDLQNFINEQAQRVSPKTIKNYLILLSGAFKQAVKDNLISNNPCECVTIPRQEKTEMVALTKSEKDLFIEINKDNPYIDIFIFALNTGMRISEICGLTKDCVDLDNGFILVYKQLVRIKGGFILDTPKTSQSKRKVPINEITRSILMKFITSGTSEFVFYNPINNNMLFQNTLSMNCHRCMLKAFEITKKEVYSKANFHSFRHTFATQWVIQGGNVNLLSKCLGHTDPSFTQRVYVQPDYGDVKNELSKLVF